MTVDLTTGIIGLIGVIIGAFLQYPINKYVFKNNLISETRLKIYSSLWSALVELKDKGDTLWQEANQPNLLNFSEALRNLRTELTKSRIVLNESEYMEISKLLQHFESYRLLKQRLIDVRSTKYISDQDIESMIQNNANAKNIYEHAMDKILLYINKKTL